MNSIQQVVRIPVEINSAPAIANLTLYAIEIQFIYTLYRFGRQIFEKCFIQKLHKK